MENLSYVYDPLCEKAFWADNNNNIYKSITNPVCAVTGGLIVIMVLCTSNIKKTDDTRTSSNIKKTDDARTSSNIERGTSVEMVLFALCRASLAVVGAGTVVFHSIDDQTGIKAFNFRMCDRMPIVLMCTNIFLLYFTKLHVNMSGYTLSLCFFFVYIYMCGLILAVDSATYEHLTLEWNDTENNKQNVYETYMNVALLCPIGIILIYAMKYHTEALHYLVSLWLMIGGNLAMWALNAYLCRTFTVMFILHALYHITIAYTFLFATCVGMTFDGNWELYMHAFCWPMVIKTERSQFEPLSGDPCNFKLEQNT